jgi:predicted O-methyltransferase YrrM
MFSVIPVVGEPRADLGLNGGWRIGERAFAAIVAELDRIRARTVVEFGSGTSTIRLALAMPELAIVSIESSPEYFEIVRDLAEGHGVDRTQLRLELRRLVWQRHGAALYQSYASGAFPPSIDAVVVDGPPHPTRRGREACLYMVGHALRLGGLIFLDDYVRTAEQQIVRNWLRVYPGALEMRVIEEDHRVCVLEKIGARAEPGRALRVSLDSISQNARRALAVLRRQPRRRAN